MKKISKSDSLDKEAEAREKSWLNNQPVSQHFAVGTRVMANNLGGEILSLWTYFDKPKPETFLLVEWDDGTMSEVKPIALNR